MKKISKKEIVHTVEEAMETALQKLKISEPSKKTKKLLGKVTKRFSGRLKAEVKKLDKKTAKASQKITDGVDSKNGVASKKAKTQATKVEQA